MNHKRTIGIKTEGFERFATYAMWISSALWEEAKKGKSFRAEINYNPKAHTTEMIIFPNNE